MLSLYRELGTNLTTVLTVNARHYCAFDITKDYAKIICEHQNAGLCFVAGNPVYLTEEEHRLDTKSRIRQLVKEARLVLPSATIFVGSEGFLDLASELSARYSVIPFILLDGSIQDQLSKLRANSNGAAVYCPSYLAKATDEMLIQSFGQYALRRRWVREELRKEGLRISEVRSQIANAQPLGNSAGRVLTEAIRKLALCDEAQVQETFDRFPSIGVRYAAVLQANEGTEETERLSGVVRKFPVFDSGGNERDHRSSLSGNSDLHHSHCV
jgi:hypothetical protein